MSIRIAVGLMVLVFLMKDAPASTLVATMDPMEDVGSDRQNDSIATPRIWMKPAIPVHVPATARPVVHPSAPRRPLSANPLWTIPLRTLSATRDRPIFSATRRPPLAAEPAQMSKMVSKPKEPERPQLSLVGTIASREEGFGIFLDRSTKAALRLKIGDDFQGWKLRSIQGREAVLEKGERAVTLALPQPDAGRTDVRK